jgi:hypothetical protein
MLVIPAGAEAGSVPASSPLASCPAGPSAIRFFHASASASPYVECTGPASVCGSADGSTGTDGSTAAAGCVTGIDGAGAAACGATGIAG